MVATRTSYVVEQGPEWLAALFYEPPGWMAFVLAGTALLAILGGLWGLRRYGIDDETIVDILGNVTVIVAVGGATLLLREHADLPYLVDAGGGFAIGILVAIGLRRYCYEPALEERRGE